MRKMLVPATVAVLLGLAIAYVDSRPHWNDTGITAMSLLLVCAAFGALQPRNPWRWALAVGIWLPVWEVITTHTYGAFLALVFAFVGAYGGAFTRRLVGGSPSRT